MNKEVLEKYAVRAPSNDDFDDLMDDENSRNYRAYRIYSTKDREIYIDVRDKNGDGRLVSYNYIKQVQYVSHTLVSIIGTDFVITLEGRNLRGIIKGIHDEQIRYVQEFNSTRFDMPEDGKAVIEKITITE